MSASFSPLFDPGRVTATPAALEALHAASVDPVSIIDRHVRGDFGDVGTMDSTCLDEDPQRPHSDGLALNTLAVIGGEDRILSIYSLPGGDTVWVETVADRSYTTIYLPEEY
jgi:hypothetical protein